MEISDSDLQGREFKEDFKEISELYIYDSQKDGEKVGSRDGFFSEKEENGR